MAKNKPKIHFFGGTKQVGRSCYMLENGNDKILIDCGLYQGSESKKLNYQPFPFNPKEIKAVVITHSHIDHIGLLPKLFKDGFRGNIYSTFPTKDFASVMLKDSQGILENENKKNPLYSLEDVNQTMSLWKTNEYHKEIEISPNISFVFYNSGHILGSSAVVVRLKNEKEIKIVFSSDLGNPENMLFPVAEVLSEGDYCLIESTYGGKIHENLKRRKDIFEDIIEETIRKKGVLMIPSFAMERTQEILFELNELVEGERIPKVPVFIDSPLAIKLTEIHKKYQGYFRMEAFKMVKDDISGLFDFPGLNFTLTTQQSKNINEVSAPKIIVAGSGSSMGGRILHHEKRYLPDDKSTLLMVGYQMRGSLGRRILEGEKNIRIHGEEISVKARIEQISAYSAHADQKQLLDWLRPMRFNLKKVFIIHGDEEDGMALSQRIKDDFGLETILPNYEEVFELEPKGV
jgi:metallo-beta-lactamase family protein